MTASKERHTCFVYKRGSSSTEACTPEKESLSKKVASSTPTSVLEPFSLPKLSGRLRTPSLRLREAEAAAGARGASAAGAQGASAAVSAADDGGASVEKLSTAVPASLLKGIALLQSCSPALYLEHVEGEVEAWRDDDPLADAAAAGSGSGSGSGSGEARRARARKRKRGEKGVSSGVGSSSSKRRTKKTAPPAAAAGRGGLLGRVTRRGGGGIAGADVKRMPSGVRVVVSAPPQEGRS
jgi:hypothetical protein